jgi:hypothetical protein
VERTLTRGWWRTNAVWLVAIAVLVPVTVGVIAVNEWSSYDLGHATKPISVDPGDSTRYDGTRIGPASAEFTDAPGAPDGTRVVSATVLVTPGDEPISCVSPVLREAGGAGRQWSEASFDLEREYDPALKTSCDSALPIRYSLTLQYLVPEDATGPFVIELSASDAYPQYVSLRIEP